MVNIFEKSKQVTEYTSFAESAFPAIETRAIWLSGYIVTRAMNTAIML